jgi:cell division septation protein DedD
MSVAPSGAREAIASAPPPRVSKAREPVAKAVPKAAKAADDGKYRLFVASAKSRQEAIRIATKIKSRHRRAIARQQIAIDPEKGEGSKTVYSVKLGPYASANEPRNLCVKLRQSGYECRVLGPDGG